VIAPQKVVDTLGADVLRLWVASTDYRNEIAVSDEILKRVSDAYRRIRNTARFLLGNLNGFDPAQHLVPVKDSLLLDQWAVQQAYDTQQVVIGAYARYDFPEIVQRVQNFCTNEMGALYLDITKDRLYTMQENSPARRSAQSAMYRILEALVRWLAPILSFTAEEVWQFMPRSTPNGPRGESVLFETWYDGLDALQGSAEQRKFWSDLLAIRSGAAKLLEGLRNAGSIGAALEADVSIYADPGLIARFSSVAHELRFFFITSVLDLKPSGERPALGELVPRISPDAYGDNAHKPTKAAMPVNMPGHDVWVYAQVTADKKCIRCWHYRPDVGKHADHPEICGRCVSNLPGGPGENRQYF
ncbi:MAG TPA: class I tRNA ligase family protein, partial [Rhodanobacteraceae bacterium]|nr:class I tRNA ligase family protein [Rhodanobacteraceae bacterium]